MSQPIKNVLRLTIALWCLAFAWPARGAAKDDAPVGHLPPRPLKIVVAKDAPAAVLAAAQRIAANVDRLPALKIMANHKPAELISSEVLTSAPAESRAYAHLVLVGLPDDVVIKQAWLRDARPIQVGSDVGLYVFGFGNLLGDIGYLESGRNPFLHGAGIKDAPYEAEMIIVSGSTARGVALAADALLKQGLVNGVVADEWRRGDTTLLDRDPIRPEMAIPEVIPDQLGKATLVGLTQAGEDEYRAVLADTGVEPAVIWRAKYYLPGVWDGGDDNQTMRQFSDGLHRRGYGNTLWAAEFSSESEASSAAAKIAAAAHLKSVKDGWSGRQGPLASEKSSPDPIMLHHHGLWVEISTVPAE